VAGRSVSGTSDTILCDSATAIRDRNTTIVYTSTSNVAITVPSAAATGCGSGTQGDSNFAFATVIAPASGTATYTFTPTTSTLTVVTGSTVTLASTSVVLAPGNFATWTSPDNVNYIVRVTNASGGSGNVTCANQYYIFFASATANTAVCNTGLKTDSSYDVFAAGTIFSLDGGYTAWGGTPGTGFAMIGVEGTASSCIASFDQIYFDSTAHRSKECDGTGAVFNVSQTLPGQTASLGGGALLAGACTSGTVTITGAATGMVPRAAPETYPGDGIWWEAYVSASNTVTVKVCAAVAATPTASLYDVRLEK
jgi:hypothetical protein